METQGVLGRGLRALIPDLKGDFERTKIVEIPLSEIIPNEYQPRDYFNEEKLNELCSSIKEKGLMQPIIVRRKNDKYEIIAGERRYRACLKLNMIKLPVIIKNVDDKDSFELAIIENIQREDLNLMEKARAFRQLIEDFNLTQNAVAKQLGVERVTVANTLRLLSLPEDIQKKIEAGQLSFGHAKVLLSIDNAEDQFTLCEQVLEDNLTIRELTSMVKENYGKKIKKQKVKKEDPYIVAIKDQLQAQFGTKIDVNYKKSSQKGFIKIEYYSNDDLNRILDLLK